ncbi:Na+/H+ antiporter NhaC family protein [Cellulomonas sp. C5510]|uniref:Na+/H+ antiporter NhaC family protein n=1 Tax=Cellulomonas sp. C5510 TaxID=2871170 RepID=UPI001C937312|nr:Na+/H+ antiporter NhaC family protein [Cellulomonas sp. C5510]QZN85480.1 Na+/H+ antiporter NhaC family protein [Cellulomonas sp. C5510]
MSSTLASEGSMTGAPQQPQGPWSALVRRLGDRRTLLAYAGLAVIFLLVLAFAPQGEGATYGAWSLLPAGTLFIFILMTQQVLEGFIWASLLGAVMLARGAFFGFWIDRLFTEVAVADHLQLLVLLLLIGGLIGVFEHMGLAASFAEAAARLARGPKRSSLVTVVATGLLSNDSYLSTSGVGVSMTPVNKGFGLPRAYSAMLIRSTAEPACTLNPIGSTPVLVTGLLVTAGVVSADEQVSAYLHVLPYLFFSLAIVLVALLTAAGVLPMLSAMRRAAAAEAQEEAGQTAGAEAAGPSSATEPAGRAPHWLNMVASIAAVIVGMLITGSVQHAFIIALVVTGVVLLAQRLTSPSGYLDAVLEGMKDIFSLVLLMAIAYILVSFIADLDFAGFVIQHVSGVVAPAWLPLAVFLVFGVTELLVTLNWSLYILLIPVLVPLCEQTGANLWATVAALLSAGTWGLTASISSDVGLLTASSTEVGLFRHWITNLPYQAIAFVVAAAGFAVVGLVGA